MKIFSVNLVDYMNDSALRCDVKFYHTMSESGWNLFNAPEENNLRLADIIKEDYALCTYQDNIEYKGIPTGQTFLDDDGDIIDFQPVTSDNHPGRLKYTVTSDHILISSLRLAKSPALNFDIANLNEYVFSNGFYIFKVKDGWNKRFVLYLLRSHKLKAFLNNNLYRGIGISAYKAEDLLKIKISNIPLESQNEAVTHIASIENNIKKLKSKIKPVQVIIDEIISHKFGLDISSLYDISNRKVISTTIHELSFNNSNLRSSTRWNKAGLIQDRLLSMSDIFIPLGKHIRNTRNGFSPVCTEGSSLTAVLGLECLNRDTNLSFDNLKYTDLDISQELDCFVKNNDFFISRGNTTDLVALASIANLSDDSYPLIYPDIMIRIDFDSSVNIRYMAYIFNSFIGRLYFKYAAKGKNQTMVKTSAKEINDFFVPFPSLDEQKLIVDEITEEIRIQDTIKTQIEDWHLQIDTVIEKTLSANVIV